jgi:hypothetical protein
MNPEPEIIIAAQHRNSLQVAGIGSMESWVLMQVQLLRNSTDRPIRIRAHPRSPLRMPYMPEGPQWKLQGLWRTPTTVLTCTSTVMLW